MQIDMMAVHTPSGIQQTSDKRMSNWQQIIFDEKSSDSSCHAGAYRQTFGRLSHQKLMALTLHVAQGVHGEAKWSR